MITEQLHELDRLAVQHVGDAKTIRELDDVRVQLLGKKGRLTEILKGLGSLDVEQRPKIGQLANTVKETIAAIIETKRKTLDHQTMEDQLASASIDVSLPAVGNPSGHRHPLSLVQDEIIAIFSRLGFSVKTGPDIETDFFNFTALNIPKDHPARAMHDTFYLDHEGDPLVLRTHTSPVQIRTMREEKPPIRILAPGNVYRCDSDTSHSPMFHQIEGLYVDEKVTFGQLKGTLEYFLQALFGKNKKVRFRPSYFPFTEPSTEVDVACVNCSGKGCSVCKHSGWVEILGAGMVNPKVFAHVNYDPTTVTGFAFGVGIERIAMLKYNIPDIRLFYENDLRFLKQF